MRLTDIERPNFSGHESFAFRYGWLKKGYDRVKAEPGFFSRRDALVDLGVGKNMVASIRHWLFTLDLVEHTGAERGRKTDVVSTPLADRLLGDDGWDPYLEDDATLWLLHYKLATGRETSTTWWWAFHRPQTATLRRSELHAELVAASNAKGWGRGCTPNTIKRDVDCFIHTYLPTQGRNVRMEDAISCPLTALGLVQPTADRDRDEVVLSYGFQPSLPDAVLCWALDRFVGKELAGREGGTVSLDRLLFDEGSPGRVFRLHEDALVERLGRLKELTHGDWTYDETIGLRQLVVARTCTVDWLRRYYEELPLEPGLFEEAS